MKVRKRRRAPTSPLEKANRKSDEDFIADYLQPGAPGFLPWVREWKHPRTQEDYTVDLVKSNLMQEDEIQACFRLIEETSRSDYENSTTRWTPDNKLKEMRSEGLRYILVRDGDHSVRGFTSLMPTYEEGQPVVYCYEIHLKPDLQGTRLGALLMGFQATVAYNLPPISKVMLTCFLSNTRGLEFYKKAGFVRDDLSPEVRKLRGKMCTPDYVIMSKTVSRIRGDGTERMPPAASAPMANGDVSKKVAIGREVG